VEVDCGKCVFGTQEHDEENAFWCSLIECDVNNDNTECGQYISRTDDNVSLLGDVAKNIKMAEKHGVRFNAASYAKIPPEPTPPEVEFIKETSIRPEK
jgi:hypothetical protein